MAGDTVEVRDSKSPDAGTLTYRPEVWGGFLDDVRAGRFDPPRNFR